ncbi:MAG TPA: TolC family outer membrane protein [Methylomirabilota bacterium]|nr:TolC family outer membrane protein [Methylomirabilota bacterium]
MASHRFSLVPFALAVSIAAISTPSVARAESLEEALASAYANNSELNSARANTRAADEQVPQALSGYRPRVDAFAAAGAIYSHPNGPGDFNRRSATIGLTLTQPIFRGFRTENSVKAAEAAVRASRERLRLTEQNVLGDAIIAYMDVVQARAVLNLRRSNVEFLSEQSRATRDRLEVGEGTRTDVAQADAAMAEATSFVSIAVADLAAATARYEQVVGNPPGSLAPTKPVDKLLPNNIEVAIEASRQQHPAIQASVHNADVAAFNVKVIEGELLPSLSLEASVDNSWENGTGASPGTGASIFGRLSIPIYEGGVVYSRVRQAKETLGEARIEVDVARDQVLASLVSAWSALDSARAQTIASRAQISALQLALEGVIEEQRVGQRTTLDVLDAQNDVINARISQVRTERDVVVASYAILSAMGRLSRETLSLAVSAYKPEDHYIQVRDKWIGFRTPDGR